MSQGLLTSVNNAQAPAPQIVLPTNLYEKALDINSSMYHCMKCLSIPSDDIATLSVPMSNDDIELHLTSFFNAAKDLETYFIQIKDRLHRLDESLRLKEEVSLLKDELKRKDALIEKYSKKIQQWDDSIREIKEANEFAIENIPNFINK